MPVNVFSSATQLSLSLSLHGCTLSKIFHVKGSDVDFITEMCERYCFETEVANRRARFCRKLVVMNSPLFIPFIKSND